MRLDNAFTVTAPIEQVWTAVMDVERVAGCVPGASVLDRLSEDAYQVGMRVKLGPVTMQYRGQLDVVERDAENRRAVLRGRAKESRGQGTADATLELNLAQEGEQTHGRVHADVKLSGRAAATGQSVLNSVADQLMAQFAGNLQTILDAPAGVGAAASEGADAGVSGGAHAAPEEAETPGAAQVRSDTTVVEAVEDVADGTGVPAPPEQVTRGGASVGQVGGDEAITEAAQSAPSGRVADRISASDPRPSPDTYRGKHVDSAEDDSFDALAFARGVLATQVRQPRVLAGLVALAMLVAYLLGRASGRRHGA